MHDDVRHPHRQGDGRRHRSPYGWLRYVCALGALVAVVGCAGPPPPPDVAIGEAASYPALGYAHSLAALGWPGAKRAFQVGPGSVIGSGESAIEWVLVSAGDSVQVTPVLFERDGVPIAHWEMRGSGQRVRFEAAAAPVVNLGDSSLVASIVAEAEATGPSPIDLVLEARIRSVPEGPHAVPWDAPRTWSFDEHWQGRAAYRNGRLVAAIDDAADLADDAPLASRPARTEGTAVGALVARLEATLEPGGRRQWRFWMPLYPTPLSASDLEASVAHERVAHEARTFWREQLATAARFESDDPLLVAAWRHALVNLVMCHERDRGRWVPIGSPFQYRDIWLRDGARVVRAMALAGLSEFASDGARTLAEFQLPSGVLISQRGQLDGTGQALWAFEQASGLAADAALANELLPVTDKALGWIARQRQATTELGLDFPGLLPFGDPRDAELVRAQLVGNDAWGIAACDAAAALARRAGDDSLAQRAEAMARDYRDTFAAALLRVRHPDVPPTWQGVGRDWGNVAVGYPTRALPVGDPRIAKMAERLRQRSVRGDSDERTGLTTYGPRDSLHSYYGGDLAVWSTLTGRPHEAKEWLDALLSYSSSTLQQAEIFHRDDRGFGTNLPPHSTASAMLLDLMRNMVVCDWRDTLEVGLGSSMWARGVQLIGAPTRFGRMNVWLSLDGDRARVRLTAASVPLRVRTPLDHVAVAIERGDARIMSPGWIEAAAGVTEVEFRVAPSAEEAQR